MAYMTEQQGYAEKLAKEREVKQYNTANSTMESTVESVIRALDYEIVHLGELVDALRSRLSLVLRPEAIEASKAVNTPEPATSPLVVLLRDRCKQAQFVSGMVDEMLRTLDL